MIQKTHPYGCVFLSLNIPYVNIIISVREVDK